LSHAHALDAERHDIPEKGAIVYRLRGVLGETDSCFQFQDEVRRAMDQATQRLVLNLKEVEMLTSSGVGIIATCYTSAKRSGKAFALCCVPKHALKVLDVCGLRPLLPIHATEQEALAA
jgi:anti-anti-sigma factor